MLVEQNAGGQSTRIELKRRRFITKQPVILTGQSTESNHTRGWCLVCVL